MKGKFKSLPLKRKVQFRIAESLVLCLVFIAAAFWAWSSAAFAKTLALMCCASIVTQLAFDAREKWRALHSPLIYLAAARHDLGTKERDDVPSA